MLITMGGWCFQGQNQSLVRGTKKKCLTSTVVSNFGKPVTPVTATHIPSQMTLFCGIVYRISEVDVFGVILIIMGRDETELGVRPWAPEIILCIAFRSPISTHYFVVFQHARSKTLWIARRVFARQQLHSSGLTGVFCYIYISISTDFSMK